MTPRSVVVTGHQCFESPDGYTGKLRVKIRDTRNYESTFMVLSVNRPLSPFKFKIQTPILKLSGT